MRRTEVVNQISQAIRRVAPTATAILYGSEARGDARDDIDVLILLEGNKRDLKLIKGLLIIGCLFCYTVTWRYQMKE